MPSRSAGSLRALKMASASRRLSSLSGAAPNAVDALLKVIDRYGEKVAFAWFPEAAPRSSSSSSSAAAATITYTQFGAQIHLLAKGIDRSLQGAVEELPLHQQLVGVCMEPSVDAYVADVAVSLAGRVSVILNPDASPEELAQLLGRGRALRSVLQRRELLCCQQLALAQLLGGGRARRRRLLLRSRGSTRRLWEGIKFT